MLLQRSSFAKNMNSVSVFTFGFFWYLNILETQSTCVQTVEDYFWRDFDGLVPTDAIPGGIDESGIPTYIGQFSTVAEYNAGIANIHTIPATITRGCETAVSPYAGRSITSNDTSNVKILCSHSVSRYKWYSRTSQFPPNCRFVVAGLEDNIPMYVGRAAQGKEKLIGKVFSITKVHTPHLICPYQGGELIHENFEVLTYCY